MQITNLQAVSYYNAVSSLKDKRLPISVLFALKHNFNSFVNQIKAYEESRVKLNEIMEEGPERNEEMGKLLSESVEHDIKTIKMRDIEKIDESSIYDSLTLAELDAIGFAIVDEPAC